MPAGRMPGLGSCDAAVQASQHARKTFTGADVILMPADHSKGTSFTV